MSYVQIVKVQKGKSINMGCIYNGVCSSLVFLWQQVTNLAAVMTHCGISPSRYVSLSKLGLFFKSLCNLSEICVSNMVIDLAGG